MALNGINAAVTAINNFGTALTTKIGTKVPNSDKGKQGGVATLDGNAQIPAAQLGNVPAPAPGIQGPPGPSTYDLHSFINGKPLVNEVIGRMIACRSFTTQNNFGGSFAFCTTAPTNDFVINLLKNTVVVGTLTFKAGQTVGIFTSIAQVGFNPGDQFALQCNQPQADPTLTDITYAIYGTSS